MTASRFATKATSTTRSAKAAPKVEQPQAAYTESDNVFASMQIPTSRRVMIATIGGLLTYATSMYWSMALVEWLTVAALTFSGSAFLGYLVLVLGWFIVFIASLRLGYRVAKFALNADLGAVSTVGAQLRDATQRKVSLVRGWFVRAESIEPDAQYAEFTGFNAR